MTPVNDPIEPQPIHPGEAGGPPGPDGSAVWELAARATFGRLVGEARGPERIGPYEIRGVLGEGGMGVVYLAEQTAPVRRTVALKLIRRGMDSREVVARFASERQALAVMSHPGIARVFDAGTAEDGCPYFVMEHVPGVPITTYCKEKGLGLKARLQLFLQVCDAVQHAHHKAIIHRDLKPTNVLVADVDGVAMAKVIDFGIAKAQGEGFDATTALTVDGQIVGTPAYMSPEQAGLGEGDVDTRTDVYALGAILYELLTGVLPFDPQELRRGGLLGLLRIIREVTPASPSTRLGHPAPELRGDLDWIVLKALEKDRTRRYSSAAELAADLRRHLAHEPVLAGPPSTLYRARKLIRRHREKFVAAAVLVVVVAGAGVVQWLSALSRSIEAWNAGELHEADFLAARAERDALTAKLRAVADSYEWWQPPWERREEIERRTRLRQVHADLESSYSDALRSFQLAGEAAPFGTRTGQFALGRIEDLLFSRYKEAQEDGSVQVPPSFFKGQIEGLGLGTYAAQLEDRSRFQLETDPPGAEVHLFRYEEVELRLVPLPFAGGKIGQPILRVERVWDPARSPFAAGDRLVEVRGVTTRTEGELARALEPVGLDESVEVTFVRGGAERRERWVPFPQGDLYTAQAELRPGRLIDPYLQLRVTFEGYPLELGDGSGVGTTRDGTPLELELPRGSYLIVLRKKGFAEQRVPLFAPWDEGFTRVRLWRDEDVPPGFVPVAGGLFRAGDDDGKAYEPLPRQRAQVGDFLMARHEVTRRQYHEFVNDLVAGGLVSPEGRIAPRAEWTRPEMKDFAPAAQEQISLIPSFGQGDLMKREKDGRSFALPAGPEWPVIAVSMQAAVEYAHWLAEKHGGRWRFRLAHDLEWERAARGADARTHVWGDSLVRSLCHARRTSLKSSRVYDTLADIATHPADESPFGVRDLAGSASEPTLARALRYESYFVYRGANWDATHALDFRIASRNRILPKNGYRFTGIRLVAERP